ncbi:TonB-dependent siderophore receptor [Terrihabitans sp. B22-R8]|uniref:TonB-dependent siderophore receptor n=1 Tax=Terrihabitans sp. B22-R8 TaxID=3425128 RepID=UPI00403C649F
MRNTCGAQFRLVLMSGAALVALSASSAFAQSGSGEIQLQEITVEGGGSGNGAQDGTATGPVRGYVATRSSTGSKSNTPIEAIPQSVSVVGREEIDDRKALKVDEALRYTAGVSAQTFGPDPDTDWFFIRGFQATQTGVFLDGLPLYSYAFGGFQIDPFLLERVEVLKGPASVLYGGANPGGIVSLVRKKPTGDEFGYVEAGINNWGNAYLGLDVGGVGGENDKWSYRVTGRLAGGDQFTDYSEDFRGTILPQITYTPNDTTKITAYGYFAGLDEIRNGGSFLPYYGTVRDARFGRIDREAFYGEPDLDNQDRFQFLVGYEFEHEFDSWKLTQNVRYGWEKGSQIGPYGYGYEHPDFPFGGAPQPDPETPGNRLFRIGFEEEHVVNTFNVDTRGEWSVDTGPLNHSFLAGVEYRYYNIEQMQASGGGTSIDIENPVYGVLQGPAFAYIDQDLTQHLVGVYLQDQIRFGDGWLVTLNGRYDYVETDSVSPVGFNFSPSFKSDDSALSGRAGLAYEFDNGFTPYVSAATFFNPVFDATPIEGADDEPFSPEEGYQFEAGFKYKPAFADALITASVFHIVRENVVQNAPTDANQNNKAQLGEVTSTGFEIEAKANLTENLKVLGAFTAYDLEITEDVNAALIGNTPFVVPEVIASLWLDYGIKDGTFKGVSFGGGVRYQGRSFADNLNQFEVPGATLVDAAVRYEREDWGVALNVTNLLDKEYVKSCQDLTACGYGDSRTLTLSAHYKW